MAVSASKSLVGTVDAKSQHVSDPLVQPFLQPDFDPADYLNSTLPALSISSAATRARAVPLPELSSQLQTLLGQLNAQTSRLSNTLTQLTDEIIRSGSRLAYDVDVLRGETLGLTDSLQNGLKRNIEVFVPVAEVTPKEQTLETQAGEDAEITSAEDVVETAVPGEPEYLEQLRTLATVRERLDSVIKTFGSAMQWPVAPSELSLTSSLISVSAPDSSVDSRSREEKGKEYAEKLRNEVSDLLASGTEGLEAASLRVEELRALAEVFTGTAEEKARWKLVDSLQKLIDERQKVVGRVAGDSTRKPVVLPTRDYRYGNADPSKLTSDGGSGYGFLQNLRSLKSDMYAE